MIIGLTHVAVRVTDINRSIKFYSKLLGLPEQFRLTNDAGEPCLVYLMYQTISLSSYFQAHKARIYSRRTQESCISAFRVDDIQKTYKEMIERGVVPMVNRF